MHALEVLLLDKVREWVQDHNEVCSQLGVRAQECGPKVLEMQVVKNKLGSLQVEAHLSTDTDKASGGSR